MIKNVKYAYFLSKTLDIEHFNAYNTKYIIFIQKKVYYAQYNCNEI